jgi:hypothetical protein
MIEKLVPSMGSQELGRKGYKARISISLKSRREDGFAPSGGGNTSSIEKNNIKITTQLMNWKRRERPLKDKAKGSSTTTSVVFSSRIFLNRRNPEIRMNDKI